MLNEEANTVRFHVRENDIWIFNNLRVLHGRDEFDTNEGTRHFQGCYIDVDGVQSAYFRSKYLLQDMDEEKSGAKATRTSGKAVLARDSSFASSAEMWEPAR